MSPDPEEPPQQYSPPLSQAPAVEPFLLHSQSPATAAALLPPLSSSSAFSPRKRSAAAAATTSTAAAAGGKAKKKDVKSTYGAELVLWEKEQCLVFQVAVQGARKDGKEAVARRLDNDYINGTKLLNLAGLTRGKRDAILKNIEGRQVVTRGLQHLKGVWIPLPAALSIAHSHQLHNLVYPLLEHPLRPILLSGAQLARSKQVALSGLARMRERDQQLGGLGGTEAEMEERSEKTERIRDMLNVLKREVELAERAGAGGTTTGAEDKVRISRLLPIGSSSSTRMSTFRVAKVEEDSDDGGSLLLPPMLSMSSRSASEPEPQPESSLRNTEVARDEEMMDTGRQLYSEDEDEDGEGEYEYDDGGQQHQELLATTRPRQPNAAVSSNTNDYDNSSGSTKYFSRTGSFSSINSLLSTTSSSSDHRSHPHSQQQQPHTPLTSPSVSVGGSPTLSFAQHHKNVECSPLSLPSSSVGSYGSAHSSPMIARRGTTTASFPPPPLSHTGTTTTTNTTAQAQQVVWPGPAMQKRHSVSSLLHHPHRQHHQQSQQQGVGQPGMLPTPLTGGFGFHSQEHGQGLGQQAKQQQRGWSLDSFGSGGGGQAQKRLAPSMRSPQHQQGSYFLSSSSSSSSPTQHQLPHSPMSISSPFLPTTGGSSSYSFPSPSTAGSPMVTSSLSSSYPASPLPQQQGPSISTHLRSQQQQQQHQQRGLREYAFSFPSSSSASAAAGSTSTTQMKFAPAGNTFENFDGPVLPPLRMSSMTQHQPTINHQQPPQQQQHASPHTPLSAGTSSSTPVAQLLSHNHLAQHSTPPTGFQSSPSPDSLLYGGSNNFQQQQQVTAPGFGRRLSRMWTMEEEESYCRAASGSSRLEVGDARR